MKQSNTKAEFNSYPLYNQLFYVFWLEEKHYPLTRELTETQWLEIADGLGLVKKDTSIERTRNENESVFFNNVLDLGEVIIAWDGDNLVDSIAYKVNEKLKKRIHQCLVAGSR